jgi:hypothetical protein
MKLTTHLQLLTMLRIRVAMPDAPIRVHDAEYNWAKKRPHFWEARPCCSLHRDATYNTIVTETDCPQISESIPVRPKLSKVEKKKYKNFFKRIKKKCCGQTDINFRLSSSPSQINKFCNLASQYSWGVLWLAHFNIKGRGSLVTARVSSG